MKLLFIHPNMPGQYKYLCPSFANDPANQVVFITKKRQLQIPNVHKITYSLRRDASPHTHRYLIHAEQAVLQGQEVWRCMKRLKEAEGFIPDIIIGHPGWGDMLYVKDIFPDTPVLSFFEFYYHSKGADVGFNPEEPTTDDDLARVRTKNMHHLLNLSNADWGISPTFWQHSLHPPAFQSKITPIHDGINTDVAKPDPEAFADVKPGLRFTVGDEVVTYIARNFEPYRGFPTFMQAAERILNERPNCHIIAIGADDVSYGRQPPAGTTYRQIWMDKTTLDKERIHFVGRVPYESLIKLLQLSAAHIYLTYPFVLSWSAMEAMACGCVVIGSDTPPVREIITHGHNGFLVDFFDPDAVAQRVCNVLDTPDRCQAIRQQARADIIHKYDLNKLIPLHMDLIRDIAGKQLPPPTHQRIMTLYETQPEVA